MPNSAIIENLKRHLEAVINDQIPTIEDRVHALIELRRWLDQVLDEQE